MLQWQIDELRQHHRDFTVPKEGFLEQLMSEASGTLLTETLAAADELITLMAKAEAAARLA